ncbi:CpsD/CapB family tyrosine-protein kinase [Clostridium pasteurianum]|uniref:non-specific protein-tyrosine kinase n=1 Tax=Clostridium pasteurianum BC1 TaxID=86416 RepID=R4K005_CLOPA|nr:CpsD/CapB family tyrosine-protein kinase [Clostridium pasteurianum]AGK95903.1 capsular exopolysaccharide biosynthesis protein [Clostridium pasteurianum BC1]
MLIVKDNPKSPISEAYRTLRTNIQFSSFDNNLDTILVTSSGPSEGKSVTASNLAVAMSEIGKKVLIIDCDLRKPSIHKKFNVSNNKGLSNLLIGQSEFDEVVQKYTENLYVLTSGTVPPNPSEMLESNKMKSFLEEAESKFDFVLIDTPPVIAVADAQILSTMVKGVLLVIASGEAEIAGVKKAKELLDQVKANIIGVVLNKENINSGKKYGYYHYYYGRDKSKKKEELKNSNIGEAIS